jgi:alkylated DNA repair dioxygenase AlkB
LNEELSNLGASLVLDFITNEEEQFLMSNIIAKNCKRTKARNSIHRYGSNLPYKGNLISKSIPSYFNFLLERLVQNGFAKKTPESVTVNEYHPGQEITAHIDSRSSGEIITVLSVLSDATMVFAHKKIKQSLFLPARSLIQMQGEIRYIWTHAILPVESLRYSIVFRCSDE